jgi:hypothetical protein
MSDMYIPDNFNRSEIIRHVLNNRLNVVTGRLELALDCNTINNIKEQVQIALTACRGLADAIVEVSKDESTIEITLPIASDTTNQPQDEVDLDIPIGCIKGKRTLWKKAFDRCRICGKLTAVNKNKDCDRCLKNV